jgi:hypothetical protein
VKLSDGQIAAIEQSGWFRSATSSYLVLDGQLRIRAANPANYRVTGTLQSDLLGEEVFDAFPANPESPESAIDRATHSFDLVLRQGVRHAMGIYRHDLADPNTVGKFRTRLWTAVNHPIKEGPRTIALLHQVDNVTHALLPKDVAAPSPAEELHETAKLLHRSFPMMSLDEVLGVVAHSQAVVVETLGVPNIARAQQLAALRLEVQLGIPASSDTEISRADSIGLPLLRRTR